MLYGQESLYKTAKILTSRIIVSVLEIISLILHFYFIG